MVLHTGVIETMCNQVIMKQCSGLAYVSFGRFLARDGSLSEGGVPHPIHGGWRFVAGNETLAEIPHKVVVGRFRLRLRDPAKTAGHLLLHLKPRKLREDRSHLFGSD